jgi:hypothetical protein
MASHVPVRDQRKSVPRLRFPARIAPETLARNDKITATARNNALWRTTMTR